MNLTIIILVIVVYVLIVFGLYELLSYVEKKEGAKGSWEKDIGSGVFFYHSDSFLANVIAQIIWWVQIPLLIGIAMGIGWVCMYLFLSILP